MNNGSPNKWLVALSVFTGSVMATIDTFILYVATPHLRGVFSATVTEISWINSSYSISALVCMLMSSWLCDHFGRKRVYQAGLCIFVIASILCGISGTLEFLIFARILQGIGAGILLPVENVILRQTFAPKEHGLVMGIYGTTVMIGPALGPLLGGLMIDNFHWSFIFYVNVPIGIIGLMMVHSFVKSDDTSTSKPVQFDWIGIVFLIIGIFTLVWLLERGDRLYWFETTSNVVLLLVSLSSLALFCAQELMTDNPAVDLRCLKNRVFSSSMLMTFLLGFTVTGTLFILPIYMQEVLFFSATKAGTALAPRAIIMMFAFPLVGYLFNKIQPKILIYAGLVIGVYSSILMTNFTHETSWNNIVLPQMLQGLAVVLILAPLTTVALMNVSPDKLPAAAGFEATSRQLGGAIGIAVFASLLAHFDLSSWAEMRHNISLSSTVFYKRFNILIDYFILSGSSLKIAQEQAFSVLGNVRYLLQVMVVSYMKLFQIITILFFVLIFVTFLTKIERPKTWKIT